MSCTITNRNYVAQESMALVRNPFQFRLSPLKPVNDVIDEKKSDEEDQVDDEKKLINESSIDKDEIDEPDKIDKEGNESDKIDKKKEESDEIGAKKDESNKIDAKKDESNKIDEKKNETTQPNESTLNNDQTSDNESDDEIDDFKKGVRIDVLCKEDFYLCYYWGVKIDQFHNFMRLNSKNFKERMFDGSLFENAYLEMCEPKL